MSWEKVKLGEICKIEKGAIGIQKAIPGKYPLVVTADERKSHNEFQFDDEAVIIPLVSGTGHGHASIKRIHFQKGKFALGNILCAVIPKDKTQVSAEYLFRYLDLNKENELVARMKGMANVTLPMKEIALIEIPLPSINEQMEFVNKYKKLEIKSGLLFSELSSQLLLVKNLRQQLLQDAVQGKLVKQDPNDEPASELFKKIEEEKEQLINGKRLKKANELSFIKDEDIPFSIPENWMWCRLGEIIQIKGGKRVPNGYSLLRSPTNHAYIRITDMKKGTVLLDDIHYISDNVYNIIKNYIIKKEDLYITIAGTIGQVGEIPYQLDNMNLTENAARIILYYDAKLFLKYCLNSSYCQIQFADRTKAMAQPKLALKRIETTLIAFPPLKEQNRIVQKLDELMKFCDDLEESIKQSASQNERLLQQVLSEALQ
jgi:type I restriction enzyme, S subunit